MPKLTFKKYAPVLASLGLLAGAASDKVRFLPPADAAPYHQHVRDAAGVIPARIGDWVGKDVPVPYEAVKLLKPNVLISRRYENEATGEHVSVLMVQVRDARQLGDHYPPICYANQGYAQLSAEPHDWSAPGLSATGTEYTFARHTFEMAGSVVVDNFMIMPDGRIMRDMDGVRAAAADLRQRWYGAAEVQVVFDPQVRPQRREEIVGTFVTGFRGLIEVIRSAESPRKGS